LVQPHYDEWHNDRDGDNKRYVHLYPHLHCQWQFGACATGRHQRNRSEQQRKWKRQS
jgi:hypothetical protein